VERTQRNEKRPSWAFVTQSQRMLVEQNKKGAVVPQMRIKGENERRVRNFYSSVLKGARGAADIGRKFAFISSAQRGEA